MDEIIDVANDLRVLVHRPDEGRIGGEADAVELIGRALGASSHWVAVPVEHVLPAFFDLRSGLAGAFLQKFATYRIGIAVVGSIEHHLDASQALRAFVHESNSGADVWFVEDLAGLQQRLAGVASGG